jgi:hypothetical protein
MVVRVVMVGGIMAQFGAGGNWLVYAQSWISGPSPVMTCGGRWFHKGLSLSNGRWGNEPVAERL